MHDAVRFGSPPTISHRRGGGVSRGTSPTRSRTSCPFSGPPPGCLSPGGAPLTRAFPPGLATLNFPGASPAPRWDRGNRELLCRHPWATIPRATGRRLHIPQRCHAGTSFPRACFPPKRGEGHLRELALTATAVVTKTPMVTTRWWRLEPKWANLLTCFLVASALILTAKRVDSSYLKTFRSCRLVLKP